MPTGMLVSLPWLRADSFDRILARHARSTPAIERGDVAPAGRRRSGRSQRSIVSASQAASLTSPTNKRVHRRRRSHRRSPKRRCRAWPMRSSLTLARWNASRRRPLSTATLPACSCLLHLVVVLFDGQRSPSAPEAPTYGLNPAVSTTAKINPAGTAGSIDDAKVKLFATKVRNEWDERLIVTTRTDGGSTPAYAMTTICLGRDVAVTPAFALSSG